MRRDRLVQLAALAAMAAIVVFFALRPEPSVAADVAPATPSTLARVKVAHPQRKDLTRVVGVPADLLPAERAVLTALADGPVSAVGVDKGDRVAKGDTLVTIDVPERQRRLETARAHVALVQGRRDARAARVRQVRAEVGRSTAESRYRHRIASRAEKVRAGSPDLISPDTVDEAVGKRDVAKAGIDASEGALATVRAELAATDAEIAAAEALVRELETSVALAAVPAPFAGVITRRLVDRGTYARMGTTELLEVMSTDPIRLQLYVSEPDVPAVREGARIHFSVDELPGRTFEAKVVRTQWALDLESRSMLVEAEVPNPGKDAPLRPGMFARARLDLETRPKALVVPAEAVSAEKAKTFVMVVKDGMVEKRQVKIGADDGIAVEILDGVSESEAVIVAGKNLVAAGDRVEAVLDASK